MGGNFSIHVSIINFLEKMTGNNLVNVEVHTEFGKKEIRTLNQELQLHLKFCEKLSNNQLYLVNVDLHTKFVLSTQPLHMVHRIA